MKRSSSWAVAATVVPVAVDGVHVLLFEPLNAAFRGLLDAPSGLGMGVIVGVYAALLVALFQAARLKPEVPLRVVKIEYEDRKYEVWDWQRFQRLLTSWPKLLTFYPTFAFGIIVGVGLANVGMGDGVPGSESQDVPGFEVALGVYVVVLIAHLGVGAAKIEARTSADEPGYLVRLLAAAAVCAIALNLSHALWLNLLGDPANVDPARAGKGLDFAVLGALYLFLFAGPRFAFMSRHFTWPALASGLALVGWLVWGSLAVVAL